MCPRIGIPSWFCSATAGHESLLQASLHSVPQSLGPAALTVAGIVSRARGTTQAQVQARAALQCTHFDVYYNTKNLSIVKVGPGCLRELISIICWAYIHEESCTHNYTCTPRSAHPISVQFWSSKNWSSCAVQRSHFQKLCKCVTQYCWMCASVGLTVPWVVEFLSSRFPL